MIKLSICILAGIFLYQASASARCMVGERELSRRIGREEQACTASGYCQAWGHNPATGRYEYFYGFHPDCPGRQDRPVTVFVCQRSEGSIYEDQEEGMWGPCMIR